MILDEFSQINFDSRLKREGPMVLILFVKFSICKAIK